MKKILHMAIVGAVVFLANSCWNSSDKAATEEQKEIKVGIVYPMTGPIATYGQESINGIKLALETKLKDKTYAGKKLTPLFQDNKSESLESANIARKFISVDNVQVILGEATSSNTLAMAPIAQGAKVPLLTTGATNITVTQVGEYISRICFTDDFQGVVMAKFAAETLQKKKAVIVVDNSSDYSRGLSKVFQEQFPKLGGEILNTQELAYRQGDKDFRTLLTKVASLNPEVVFVPGYPAEIGPFLKQAHEMGIKAVFLGGDGWDSPDLFKLASAEALSQGEYYFSSHFAADDSASEVQEFVNQYKARYGENPGAMAALAYDGILFLSQALERASSHSREDIRNALVSTANFQGVTGTITLDQNRNPSKSAVVLKVLADKGVFFSKVSP